jgi:myo-inositol-1(or 4)-monophosphatase
LTVGSIDPAAATAAGIAREAGAVLRELRDRASAWDKPDGTLLTEADLAAERLIVGRLRAAYPEDAVLAEEGGATGAGDRLWIVDPLDGTTNYSHRLPLFAVSIARFTSGEPELGVVYLPILDELFLAVRGQGATLNGAPIQVSAIDSVNAAMVNVYFDRRRRLEEGLALLDRVGRAVRGRVKVMGSTASLLCYTACGRLDGFVRNTTRVWDFAAGALIVKEAGGRVTDFEGRPLCESGQSLLASNGRIHDELARLARGEESE